MASQPVLSLSTALRILIGPSALAFQGGFTIRAKQPRVDIKGVLGLLSNLYPNKAFALVRENLQNSIDAGAQRVTIDFDPKARVVTFADDGSGVSTENLNENDYFSLQWSTKRGKDKIGSKGIGRWTNLAAARRVIVESRSPTGQAVFTWHATGSFSRRPNSPTSLRHTGLLLRLEGLTRNVAEELPLKVEDVSTSVFDEYLRQGLEVHFNGRLIRPKEYKGKRHRIPLKQGGTLELYWHREGQSADDRGIVLKCRGVRVGSISHFGIESEEWTNIAGILHLDHLGLIANRDAFEETPAYRAAITEARTKIRSFIAKMEGGRRFRRDQMEDAYTKAARQAALELGLDLSILGVPKTRIEQYMEPQARAVPSSEEPVHSNPKDSKGEGQQRGFRLRPTDFRKDSNLKEHENDMSWRQGSVILVNIGHPSCPENRFARSLYIWCCGLVEILRWGVLEGGEQLDRGQLLRLYTGWLSAWPRDLARVTAGNG